MLGSKNDFFKLDILKLKKAKEKMNTVLKIKGRTTQDILEYEEAYDFFVNNPTEFDGATIVKDLVDIRVGSEYLDVDAMQHDFDYLRGANKSFSKKWKSDYKYIRNMELNGKGIRVFRFILLTLIGIVFVPYKNIV